MVKCPTDVALVICMLSDQKRFLKLVLSDITDSWSLVLFNVKRVFARDVLTKLLPVSPSGRARSGLYAAMSLESRFPAALQ